MSRRDLRCIVPLQCAPQPVHIIVPQRTPAHCKSRVKNDTLFLHTHVYTCMEVRGYTVCSVWTKSTPFSINEHGETTMQHLLTRITRILRSPRGALGLFAALRGGTAAVALAPQAIGGGEGASAGNATGLTVHQGTDGVTLSGTLSQTKLIQGGNGVMYLDLGITTPSTTLSPSRVKASDIVVVLDRSGSMAADNRLPYAQEAVRRLVRQLRADDRFALITFDSVAVVDTELTPITDAVRERIVQRVNAIRPGSSTNISDGLLKARALLQGNAGEGPPLMRRPSADTVAGNGPDGPASTQSPQRSRKVILLSDGEANMGIVAPKELA